MEGRQPVVSPEYLSQLANGLPNSSSQNLFLTLVDDSISVSSFGEYSHSVGVNVASSHPASVFVSESVEEYIVAKSKSL
jgi:hypothetical protein